MKSSGSSRLVDAGSVMYERLGTYGALVPPFAVAIVIKAVEVLAGIKVPTLLAVLLFAVAILAGLAGQWRYETRPAPESVQEDEPEAAEFDQAR